MRKITLFVALAVFAVGFGQQTEHFTGKAPTNQLNKQQNSRVIYQPNIQVSADGVQGFESKASHIAGVTEKPVFRSASSIALPMLNKASMGGECLSWINPTPATGWGDFNTQFGGAPTEAQGCPFNEIQLFEVYASEAYTVDNFVAGVEYTFSICNGPGAGNWVPDFTIIAPGGIVDAFGAGDGDGCSITWTASATGTYLIVINEEGFCGGGPNTATDNGFPALTCTGGGGGGSFPAPYCGPITFALDVEPITLVEVAGISNVSSAVVNGSAAHEDFTSIIGAMDPGESYTIALEGNTAGNFTTSFTVFIDWNQNGSLDDAGERYNIGSITNSTGTDGQQAIGSIAVPAGASLGDTRMRVIKRFTAAYATSSCIPGSSFGQAEDYTINVGGTGGGDNEWTVNVQGTGFGDEVSWELRDNLGAVLLSGGPYGLGYNDTQTVTTSNEPLEFFIESEGAFGDNTPFYTISCSGNVVLQGVLPGGVSQTFSDLECESGGGGGDPVLAYGINNSTGQLVSFDINNPFILTPIGTSPVTQFENAGAIDPNNPTIAYVLDNVNNFYSVDITTGVYVNLGTVVAPGGQSWVGMEFDTTTGTLYAISGTINVSSSLSIINIGTLTATLVGNTGMLGAISLAIDGNGNVYSHDIVSDSLYSVNKVTGVATIIGPLGFDANFGQGMTWDPNSDQVYMSAFNNSTFQGEWRTVNTATGATSLVGVIVPGSVTQMGWVSIPDVDGSTGNNEECAGAIALSCGDVVTGTTTDATNSGGNASPDVFYKYTGSGQLEFVTISLCGGGTNYDTILRVFADCGNLGVGEEIVLNDDFCGLQSQLTFESDGTSTYIIMVEGFGTGSGDFSLEITCELPPGCGDIFTDSGGATGNYSNNEDTTWTFFPDNTDDYVIVTFNEFDVEIGWDALYVFDGPDTSFPLISSGNPPTGTGFPAGGYYGTGIPGPFASTHPSGALTFRFLSDGSVTRPGWVADITCLPVPPPNDLIVNAIDVDQFPQAYTDPAVRLLYATNELLNPQGCNIAGTNGVWYKFTATADGTAEASITTPSGASAVIFYSSPNENVADETELTYTFGQTNQCGPGTSSTVVTVAGQSYYLFVLNTGGESDVVIDISNSLGTNENVIDGFTFYPNPMDGVLNLRSKSSIDNVIIYNMLGQKIIDQNIGATATQLQVSSLSTGAYLMKVVSQGQTATYRILKK